MKVILMLEAHNYTRLIEAALFASATPLTRQELQALLPNNADIDEILHELHEIYKNRGVNLVRHLDGYLLTSAPDLAPYLVKYKQEQKKLSRAALETLAIIAYHQPVTRADIEEVRGVALSKGTLDILLETGWVKPKGRKKIPGRPLCFGTTESFLVHFGLTDLKDLPAMNELKSLGLLESGHAMHQLSMDEDDENNETQSQLDLLNQAFGVKYDINEDE